MERNKKNYNKFFKAYEKKYYRFKADGKFWLDEFIEVFGALTALGIFLINIITFVPYCVYCLIRKVYRYFYNRRRWLNHSVDISNPRVDCVLKELTNNANSNAEDHDHI